MNVVFRAKLTKKGDVYVLIFEAKGTPDARLNARHETKLYFRHLLAEHSLIAWPG